MNSKLCFAALFQARLYYAALSTVHTQKVSERKANERISFVESNMPMHRLSIHSLLYA